MPPLVRPIRQAALVRNGWHSAVHQLRSVRKSMRLRKLQKVAGYRTDAPNHVVSLRKDLKDEARRRRTEKRGQEGSDIAAPPQSDWELTVGIEIHAELNTGQKLFSSASTADFAEPNTNVALFDLAYPGAQPQFQIATLIPALRAAIALNCRIQTKSTFDRKHYFYQDQPAGYQITQYYEPFARDGYLVLHDYDGAAPEDGKSIQIGIKQIQIEQDTAKTLQQPSHRYFLDFNRVSSPLIEIISLPQIHHPSTAAAFVRKVQNILKSVDASVAGMEIGGLRADINVSVRRRYFGEEIVPNHTYHGITGLGQKTEIKNLNSFKAVEDAIIAERDRQIKVLEEGGVVEGETRGWALGSTETRKLRGKEDEIDYRYMPDPDLPPVIVSEALVSNLRTNLPLLPDALLGNLTASTAYGLSIKDAKTLLALDEAERLEYYLALVDLLTKRLRVGKPEVGRLAGNWVLHEIGNLFAKAAMPWNASAVPAEKLADIVALLFQKKLVGTSARRLLQLVFDGDARPVDVIVSDENLAALDIPADEYMATAQQVIDQNQEMVKAIKGKGQKGKIMWFVGQVMREMSRSRGQGSVEAEKARVAVAELLQSEEAPANERRSK